MKTTLITVSVAAVALWVGYTIGYHHGADATFAIFRPRHFVSEVTTYSVHAVNRGPQMIVFTNGVVSK
jgi:hypothetical protein